jgi:hypothetical protein
MAGSSHAVSEADGSDTSTGVRGGANSSSDAVATPLERDPRKPGYDAARLFALRYDGARQIYEAEPRDPTWASQRESDIATASRDALKQADPDVRVEIECHMSSCRVRIHSRNPYLTDQMAFYPIGCLASFAQPEWGDSVSENPHAEDPFSDVYLMFGQSTRAQEGFVAQRDGTCLKYREEWLRGASKR